jgi:hypothetical protein
MAQGYKGNAGLLSTIFKDTSGLFESLPTKPLYRRTHLKVVCKPVTFWVCVLNSEEDIFIWHNISLWDSSDTDRQVTIMLLESKMLN